MYDTKEGIPSTIQKDLLDDHETYTVREKIKKHYHYLLYALPLQPNLSLTSGTARPLSLPPPTDNLYNILRTFASTDTRINKSKFRDTQDI